MAVADEARAEAERRWPIGFVTVGESRRRTYDFQSFFMTGAEWQRSRDVAEVADLTAQLQAAQATIAEIRKWRQQWGKDTRRAMALSALGDILSRVDTSAYDAAIRAARVKELWDVAANFGLNQVIIEGDVKEWLLNRAASIEQTEADRG